MAHIQRPIRVTPLTCAITTLMLATCSSGDSGSGNSPNPSPNGMTSVAPIGKVANSGDSTVMTTGQAVSNLGSTLQNTSVPGLPDQTKAGLGGMVGNTGKTVSDLGLGIQTGLGKMGRNPNPISTAVASTSNVVTDLGQATVSTSSLVQGLGQGSGVPLTPITQSVGGGVQQVDRALIGGNTLLGSALSSGAIQQVMQQLSTAIVPVTMQTSGATQMVGDSTGLSGALNNLLGTISGDVADAGNTIAETGVPVVPNLDPVVTSLGVTVAATDGVATTSGSAGGNPLSGLLNRVGGSTSGSNPLAPLTGLLGGAGGPSPLAPVTSALGGTAGGSNPLAPVTELLGSVTSAASRASDGSPLAPATNLLDDIDSPVH